MNPDTVQFFCDYQPYYKNSHEYFIDHVNHFETPYWIWMMREYKTVLLNKQGSWSDQPDQHWGFREEKDMTFFKLRWA
jgi:hypothetical protein